MLEATSTSTLLVWQFFTKMLNISTSSVNALHTSLWTWRAEGRTGARSSQTDIYTFYLLGWDSVCVWRRFLVSHSPTVCHILVSVNKGKNLVCSSIWVSAGLNVSQQNITLFSSPVCPLHVEADVFSRLNEWTQICSLVFVVLCCWLSWAEPQRSLVSDCCIFYSNTSLQVLSDKLLVIPTEEIQKY